MTQTNTVDKNYNLDIKLWFRFTSDLNKNRNDAVVNIIIIATIWLVLSKNEIFKNKPQ